MSFSVARCTSRLGSFRYENFQAKGYPNCPCLITFEGDNFMYGLNFADLEEARNFKQYLDKRYETEQKRKSNLSLIYLCISALSLKTKLKRC